MGAVRAGLSFKQTSSPYPRVPTTTREVRPGPKPRHVIAQGLLLAVPEGWDLLPPGDAALSRRIKEDGPAWTVVELKGNKRFSRGIWAPAYRISALRAQLLVERANPAYQKKLAAGRTRRAEAQVVYAEDFRGAVLQFLRFHPVHQADAELIAERIVAHAVPVGSGTVARTQRIPIEQRAEAATIAWLRHQTTGYDHMTIARVRGERREVRRMLAQRSRELLERYRQGRATTASCPLQAALRPAPVGTPRFV